MATTYLKEMTQLGGYHTLDLFVFAGGPQAKASGFEKFLQSLSPHEYMTISCIDFREQSRESFLLTSAGNIPHLEDVHLILPGKRLLLLRCHTDCAKSKAELPKAANETDGEYSERLEAHTLQRLWRDAKLLVEDPKVQAEIKAGMWFMAARFDVENNQTEYFEAESNQLVQKIVFSPERSATSCQ